MRLAWILAGLSVSAAIGAAQGAPDVWGLELRGEAAQAQARLQQAAAAPQASAAAVRAWAEFLDRYRDPGARENDRPGRADEARADDADRSYRRSSHQRTRDFSPSAKQISPICEIAMTRRAS